MISKTTLLGAAGEHYVMAQLLTRGLIAALAPQGVPNLDIVVSDIEGRRQFGVQVKSRQNRGSDGGWHMGEKHETIAAPSLFYCFVDFGDIGETVPVCYILPSETVAKVIRETHQAWLSRPGRLGQVRNNSKLRRLVPDYSSAYAPDPPVYALGWLDPYREAWHLLPSPDDASD
ncbi:hypothetical protein LPB142_13455 [Rhodobacter xanthinilyticus]|uniref:Aspartate ammonia-lyase n=2 Tax=Rhodobacter xanthinilyticus TaxID=1850250 RepID=A0A1D9MEM6_9RHOB|nr:hypothetical protein LPB142_13455 [Rhodobacter xanthinilyticus]